jgi:hypothetical protein
MRKVVGAGFAAAVLAAAMTTGALAPAHGATTATRTVRSAAALAQSPTVRVAGPQHWCNTNGVICADPYQNWEDFPAYDQVVKDGVPATPYIGHDEPAINFYSHTPGSGNNVTYRLVLPKDPPTTPQQDGSGGTDNFQHHIAIWFGMIMCDPNGSPNPDGAALTGHATVPCKPDSDTNAFASLDPSSPRYIGLTPGQAFMEMQFYPPGWAPWPAGVGCTARQWCAALNIDTFNINQNTQRQFNNDACLSTVGFEPVNFAFLTKNGVAAAPAGPTHPEHFTPDLARDFLMGSGDTLRIHMFDTASGFRVVVDDLTTHTTGSMTASAANGFASVVYNPTATTCTTVPHTYHPMYSTSTPVTRVTAAAHTYNVSFSDEIGHFEYCAKVNNDAFATCARPLGDDTNNPDNAGPDPEGDDDFCLPASASLLVKIGGCLDSDGDFDGPSYQFTWPGSISNLTADRLLTAQPVRFTSPKTNGRNFDFMAFEADMPRIESDDISFGVTPCQRHIVNPSDPNPGAGCVNPPPGTNFYPFYSTTNVGGSCWWVEGGRYLPNTTNKFGGSSVTEFGTTLLTQAAPTAPYGTIAKRFNNFRHITPGINCPAS